VELPPALQAEQASGLERLRRRVTQGELGQLPVIAGLVVIWAVFQALNPNFLSPRNLTNLMVQIADIGTIAVGLVLVLLLGEIDLSAGSVSGLGAGVMGVLAVKHGVPPPLAILAGVLTGTVIGAFQGFWFTRFKIPSFVVTLAGLLAFQGLLILILGTTGTINLFDPGIDAIAGSFLSVPQGWAIAVVAVVVFLGSMFLSRRRRAAAGLEIQPISGLALRAGVAAVLVFVAVFVLNSDRGIPLAALILVGFILGYDLVLRRTRFGRHIFAVGGNAEAARRAGAHCDHIPAALPGVGWMVPDTGGPAVRFRLANVTDADITTASTRFHAARQIPIVIPAPTPPIRDRTRTTTAAAVQAGDGS